MRDFLLVVLVLAVLVLGAVAVIEWQALEAVAGAVEEIGQQAQANDEILLANDKRLASAFSNVPGQETAPSAGTDLQQQIQALAWVLKILG